MRSSNEETVLGLLRKDAPDPQLNFTATVCVNETAYMTGMEIVPALRQFAILANSIIGSFDM